MNIIELKDQIVKNQLSNFYIFTGLEIGIINIYLNQMSNKLNMPITRVDRVVDIYAKCTSKSMFGNTTSFYVIRDDKDFTKEEKVWATIKKDIGKNVIVLLFDKIDSRLKFGKYFKDDIVSFEKLAPNILKAYIKKEISLSDKNVEKLAELCNCSYDLCMLEIDKIKQHTDSLYLLCNKKDYDEGFSELLKCGAIYQPEESDVFQFVTAVCNHNKNLAFKLEQNLRESGQSSINLLGTLYNSLKSVMLIQCCENSRIGETTGLDNRQIYYNKQYVGKYKTEKLVESVRLISKVVSDIKSGRIDDVYATRYVLSQVM